MIPAMDVQQRFWRHVDKTAGCWLWTGARCHGGYAQFRLSGHPKRGDVVQDSVHRIAYRWLVGEIAPGMQLDHRCRVRTCVNPSHLEVVTPRENTLRGNTPAARNAHKTHCPRGHAYAGPNLLVSGGKRHCRTCKRGAEALRAGRKRTRTRRRTRKTEGV